MNINEFFPKSKRQTCNYVYCVAQRGGDDHRLRNLKRKRRYCQNDDPISFRIKLQKQAFGNLTDKQNNSQTHTHSSTHIYVRKAITMLIC